MKKYSYVLLGILMGIMVAAVAATIIISENNKKVQSEDIQQIITSTTEETEQKAVIEENEDALLTETEPEEITVEAESHDENNEEVNKAVEEQRPYVICIDPGHGGSGEKNEGVVGVYDGINVYEKNLNLEIALKLKSYLEEYDNIAVVMTRTDDRSLSIDDRIYIANKNKADFLISIHNNSSSRGSAEDNGCLVIAPVSSYKGCQEQSVALARCVLEQLTNLGLPYTSDWDANVTEGILQRKSEKGATYPDGSARDYYGLIAKATEIGMPSIIIEHAFVSSPDDYRSYLSDDSKLDALAYADAAGIIKYIEETGL